MMLIILLLRMILMVSYDDYVMRLQIIIGMMKFMKIDQNTSRFTIIKTIYHSLRLKCQLKASWRKAVIYLQWLMTLSESLFRWRKWGWIFFFSNAKKIPLTYLRWLWNIWILKLRLFFFFVFLFLWIYEWQITQLLNG